MIDKEHFKILNFVKLEPYTGSMDGMRYMIKKVPGEAVGGGDPETKPKDRLQVIIWPEPFSISATAEDQKTYEYFELSSDGIEDIADYLNKQLFDRADEWKAAKEKGFKVI